MKQGFGLQTNVESQCADEGPHSPRSQFEVNWIDRAGGRKARCAPNPDYPDGIDVDAAAGSAGCIAQLPYPAEHLGLWIVKCRICGFSAGLTAAGRPDDPRSVKVPCNPIGKPQ